MNSPGSYLFFYLLLTVAFFTGLLQAAAPSHASQVTSPSTPECALPYDHIPGSHNWTKHDIRAWNEHLCIGEDTVPILTNKSVSSAINLETCEANRSIVFSSAFIRKLLTYRPILDIFDLHGINSIKFFCGSFHETLDLSHIRSPIGLQLINFHFAEGLHVIGASLFELAIDESQLASQTKEPLLVQNTTVTSMLHIANSTILGKLDLTRSRGDILQLNDSEVTGKTILDYAEYNHIGINGINGSTTCNLGAAADNSQRNSLTAYGLVAHERLQISKCRLQGDVSLTRAHIANMLLISNTPVMGDVSIDGSNIPAVRLQRAKLTGDLHIRNSALSSLRIFDESVLQANIRFTNSGVNEVELTDSDLGISTVISGSEIKKRLWLRDVVIDESIFIYNSTVRSVLELQDVEINSSLISSSSTLGKLEIRGASIGDTLGLLDTEVVEVDAEGKPTSEGVAHCYFHSVYFRDSHIGGSISRIGGDVKVSNCEVKKDVYVSRSRVLGDLSFEGSHVGGMLDFSRSKIDGDLKLTNSSEWQHLDASRAVVEGDVSIEGVSSWNELNFEDSEISGEIRTKALQSLDNWSNASVSVNLRNADLTAFRLGSGASFEQEGQCVLKKWDADDGFKIDLFGSRYDGRQMKEFLGIDVSCLAQVVSSAGHEHSPQPYIYMAERLEEIGEVEAAESLRIEERERALAARTGIDGIWQWIIARTTGFGYSPELALVWFVILVCVGTLYVVLAGSVGVDKPIRGSWTSRGVFWFRWIGVFFVFCEVLAAIFLNTGIIEIIEDGAEDVLTWDHWGFGSLALVVWIGMGLALEAPEFRLRTSDEQIENSSGNGNWRTAKHIKWRGLARAGLLYSLDRAIPFLGFDGEHVRWFAVEGKKLNDMPLALGMYFYVHSALGFALISLFIAGVTGVLK